MVAHAHLHEVRWLAPQPMWGQSPDAANGAPARGGVVTRAPGEKSPGGYFGFGGVALTFLPKVLSFFSFLRIKRAANIASLSRCFSARPSRQAFRGGASRSLTISMPNSSAETTQASVSRSVGATTRWIPAAAMRPASDAVDVTPQKYDDAALRSGTAGTARA